MNEFPKLKEAIMIKAIIVWLAVFAFGILFLFCVFSSVPAIIANLTK